MQVMNNKIIVTCVVVFNIYKRACNDVINFLQLFRLKLHKIISKIKGKERINCTSMVGITFPRVIDKRARRLANVVIGLK